MTPPMSPPTIRTLLTVAVMLTLAPVVAATTLVCWQPDRWGGSVNPLDILFMAFLGLITVPLWPTYILAMLITPRLMRRAAAHPAFRTFPLPWLFGLSWLTGAVAGVGVMAFVIFLSLTNSAELAMNGAAAGAVSGALTLSVICLIYRYAPSGG